MVQLLAGLPHLVARMSPGHLIDAHRKWDCSHLGGGGIFVQSMSPHPKPCVSLFCIVGGFVFENYEFIISKIFLKEHLEDEKMLMVLTIKNAPLQKPHPLLSALRVCYLAGGR